jgi:hypothetical protein
MSQHRRSVSNLVKEECQLPDWASMFLNIADSLLESGFLDELSRRIRVQREGGYTAVDIFLFVLAYFTAELGGGFSEFSDTSRAYTEQLGAVGGRKRLPTQSSVSRFLDAVPEECGADVDTMAWILVEATGAAKIINRPEAAVFDTERGQWHCFDVDGTLKCLRHRALPEEDSMIMPDADRRAGSDLAVPGYSGRKRGQVQLCRLLVQHGGSGSWIALACSPGSDDLDESVALAVESVSRVCGLAGIHRERAILRFDGFYGSWQTIGACEERSHRYVVRWKWYQLLHDSRVVELMEQGQWIRVPDSGSGPKRYAMDVGYLMPESDCAIGLSADGRRTRVVVTRHRNEADRGIGEVLGGWRYEVFVTNLPDGLWPAPEVVACYYGRVGQENRFAQLNRELELDRIFSYSLAGQRLVTLFGLFWWNLQTVKGWQQLNTDPDASQKPPKTPRRPEVLNTDEKEGAPSELLIELDKIDWVDALSLRHGWAWEPALGLRCPAGHATPLKRVYASNNGWRAIFRARRGQCGSCPVRSTCTSSSRADFRKEFHVPVPGHLVPTIKALKKRRSPSIGFSPADTASAPSLVPWEPPESINPGPYETAGPILIPTVLRHSFRTTSRQIAFRVRVDSPTNWQLPPHLALTAAKRQHRRKTWEEREKWNALDDGATVVIERYVRRRSEIPFIRGSRAA